ncbi:MAG: hypothetical protein JXR97_11555, partial [Planctomycetes bacterium]|nr:hypothetical protein [Planctomycetota bacterium]
MRRMRNLLMLLGLILVGVSNLHAGEDNSRYMLDFEGMDALPADWVATGDISIDTKKPFNSKRALMFARTKEAVNDKTSLEMAPFPVRDGIWEIEMFYEAELNSPDSSFNGTVSIEFLNAAKKYIGKKELRIIEGKKSWREDKKKVVIPEGASYARFCVVMNKTWGVFRLDNMLATYLAPAPKTIFSSIRLAPKEFASLFLPGDDIVFDITVECTKEWAQGANEVNVAITDYWGAEQHAPITVALKKGAVKPNMIKYAGTLTLDHKAFEKGKYYELHATATNGGEDIYREESTFSIQPKPITKNYRPHEIPFTLNNWDDRIKDTFFMADRMGIRWKLVWSGWETTPPYKPYAPGIEWIKELDMGALLGVRPVTGIEHAVPGSEKITEECLREGAKNMVNAYKDMVPIMIRCGNEPHTEPETVKKSVAAYKAIYEGAKAADPNVFFISTSIGPCEEFFKQGFQNYCDAFDYHTYSGWKLLRDIDDNYKELFKKYNCEKPIFCTEIGINSQGMARLDVSRDMVKKFAIHFAEGHSNLAWFDLLYPDTKGTIVGSNAEAFNVFNAKYCLYSPKITAVTYYNMVNGICIKKFVEEKIYDGEIENVLFRDKDNRCLLVAWKEMGREEAFLPLPGVKDVRMVRIDGSERQLDA